MSVYLNYVRCFLVAFNVWRLCVRAGIETQKLNRMITVDNSTKVHSRSSSPAFGNALLYAGHLSTDELFAVFDQLIYKAFGFPAVMLYKMEHNDYWEAGLRNDVNWGEPKIDCKGKTAKDAMILMYAWCVHKGYLPCV